MSREDANLRTQMLYAIQDKDRKRGEILRTKMLEEAAESYLREVRLINDAFYSAWQDWETQTEVKKFRESMAH